VLGDLRLALLDLALAALAPISGSGSATSSK